MARCGEVHSVTRTPIRFELLPMLAAALFMAFVAGVAAEDGSFINFVLTGIAAAVLAGGYVLLAAGRGRW
jgi:hypothetical protein